MKFIFLSPCGSSPLSPIPLSAGEKSNCWSPVPGAGSEERSLELKKLSCARPCTTWGAPEALCQSLATLCYWVVAHSGVSLREDWHRCGQLVPVGQAGKVGTALLFSCLSAAPQQQVAEVWLSGSPHQEGAAGHLQRWLQCQALTPRSTWSTGTWAHEG